MCGTDVFKMYLKYLFKILNLDTHKKSKTEMRKMELKLELNFVIIHIEKKKCRIWVTIFWQNPFPIVTLQYLLNCEKGGYLS